jgi:hypothetical protein
VNEFKITEPVDGPQSSRQVIAKLPCREQHPVFKNTKARANGSMMQAELLSIEKVGK